MNFDDIGPQPELGEDVLQVLEALDDEAFEGELDDDFVGMFDRSDVEDDDDEAGSDRGDFMKSGKRGPGQSEEDFDEDEDYSDDDDGRGRGGNFETKSRFTNYSMTSSILSRTKELQFLDERFDKVMEDYDEEEIGELEDNEE